MKLTKSKLKQIIKEELQTLSEGPLEVYMQSEKAQKDWERFISGGMFSGGLLGKLIAKGQATASWDVEEFKNLYLKEYWGAGMEGHQDPNHVAGNVLRKKLMEIMLGEELMNESPDHQSYADLATRLQQVASTLESITREYAESGWLGDDKGMGNLIEDALHDVERLAAYAQSATERKEGI